MNNGKIDVVFPVQNVSHYLIAKSKVMEPGALLHGYLIFMPGFMPHETFSEILYFQSCNKISPWKSRRI